MVVWGWVQQHRVLSVLLLAMVIVACAGGTAWALVFRTVSSPVSLRQALRTYRREQSAKILESVRNRLPAPGVYTYRTRGGEGLSLMGVGRSFPASSSMIVVDSGCATVSWVPIAQHTEETVLCRQSDGALTTPELVTEESIVGSDTRSVVRCPPTAYLLPPEPAAGGRWRATCVLAGAGEKVALEGQDLGPATAVVGGRRVPVEHTRVTLTYAGTVRGTNPTDYWLVPGSGLIVREQETVAMSQAGVEYSERMEADLAALTPRR